MPEENDKKSERRLQQKYYVATPKLIHFIENGHSESFTKLSNEAGINARTLIRLRKLGRVTRKVAHRVYAAAHNAGFPDEFNEAFNESVNESEKNKKLDIAVN